MSSLYLPDLCFTGVCATDSEHLLDFLCDELQRHGRVGSEYAAAVKLREQTSPTGLPLSRHKVAIPHADPEHVKQSTVVVCTLHPPVTFAEMGNPESALAVEVVLLLALRDQQQTQKELVRLVGRCQDPRYVESLMLAPDPAALHACLTAGEQ